MTRITDWRKKCQFVILKTLKEEGVDLNPQTFSEKRRKQIEKAVKNAYPFGVRKYHPYKIWLSEVDSILTTVGVRKRQIINIKTHRPLIIEDPRQTTLF